MAKAGVVVYRKVDMHLLLTNDDGIDAPGMAALVQALSAWARCTVVAPSTAYSGCGHQVTNHEPIRIEQEGEDRYRLFGTPADCVRIGLRELAPDVDWVVSGINDGANLGVDIVMSGTVAAAREGVWLGVPAMAISQYARRDRPRNWSRSEQQADRVIRHLIAQPYDPGTLWNINLPDVDEVNLPLKEAFPEPQHLHVSYRRHATGTFTFAGDYARRPRSEGSDVDVCFSGGISVSKIRTTIGK